MTKQDIMKKLDEMGVKYDSKSDKATLEELLSQNGTSDKTEGYTDEDEKETATTSSSAPSLKLNEAKLDSAQKKMLKKLHAQPKVKIIIPKEESESEDAYETVQINGYTWQIKKGGYVSVPKQVADIIMESQQQTAEAYAKAAQKMADEERPEFDNS